MSNVVFALLNAGDETTTTVHELDLAGIPEDRCRVLAHRGPLSREPASELADFETGAAAMTARLSILTASAGVVLGAVVALASGSSLFACIAVFAVMGAIAGAFAGVVGGGSSVDPTLRRLARELQPGKVLLSVRSDTRNSQERAEHILTRHHARIVHRHVLPWHDD